MQAKEIIIRNFKVEAKDIVFIKAILEAYEGMVVLRTVDIQESVIELLIAHDFADTIDRLVSDLQSQVTMQEQEPVASGPWQP